MTVGLLPGQDVLTVPHIRQKIDAQVRGLGVGFVPEGMARPWIERGLLVTKTVERPQRVVQLTYAWRSPDGSEGERGGRALQWWLKQLKSPATRAALLVHPNARASAKASRAKSVSKAQR